jgi:hypothetical protein
MRDYLTFGCRLGFQTPAFLPLVASIQVRQSATSLQIVRQKTLQQTPGGSRASMDLRSSGSVTSSISLLRGIRASTSAEKRLRSSSQSATESLPTAGKIL